MHITIAVCGFQHEVWRNQFFPDDLPEDWYFDYYSNEFDAVLWARDEQKHCGTEALNEMLADADAEFIFVLEDCDEARMLNWQNVDCEVLFVKPVFSQIAVIGLSDHIRFEQAEIVDEEKLSKLSSTIPQKIIPQLMPKISQKKISKTACVLRVSSNEEVSNAALKQILQHIRSDFASSDHVCLFLGRSMQDINKINTVKIINDFL